MARTLYRPAAPASSNGQTAASERPGYSLAGPTRRRPSWVLFGSLMVVVAALVGAWVFAATSDRVSVVVAASDLQPGDVVDAGDLRVIEIGRSAEMRAIRPSQQDLILGRVARGPIPAGTVLNTDLFAEPGAVIPAGMVVAGAELSPGQAPLPGLRACGDAVDVLGVRPTTAAPGAGEPDPLARLLTEATVWSVADQSSGSTTRLWVSLLIPAEAQEAVAQAADELLRLSLKGGAG